MTGINYSRILKTINSNTKIKSGRSSLMPLMWSESLTISLAGHSLCASRDAPNMSSLVLHSFPPSCFSYTTIFSHHTKSQPAGNCIWRSDNLSISGRNEEEYSSVVELKINLKGYQIHWIVKSRSEKTSNLETSPWALGNFWIFYRQND